MKFSTAAIVVALGVPANAFLMPRPVAMTQTQLAAAQDSIKQGVKFLLVPNAKPTSPDTPYIPYSEIPDVSPPPAAATLDPETVKAAASMAPDVPTPVMLTPPSEPAAAKVSAAVQSLPKLDMPSYEMPKIDVMAKDIFSLLNI